MMARTSSEKFELFAGTKADADLGKNGIGKYSQHDPAFSTNNSIKDSVNLSAELRLKRLFYLKVAIYILLGIKSAILL